MYVNIAVATAARRVFWIDYEMRKDEHRTQTVSPTATVPLPVVLSHPLRKLLTRSGSGSSVDEIRDYPHW
jgi:hypothetical protein